MNTIEITWRGLDLECELEYEPADPSVGYMSEQFGLLAVMLDTGHDIIDDLTQKAQDEILDDCIAAVREEREEGIAAAQERNIEARDHAIAEREMRRMGV